MIKMMVIKMFSIFLRFSNCSVRRESHNGGSGLIAVDYTHRGEARTKKTGCESCELGKVF